MANYDLIGLRAVSTVAGSGLTKKAAGEFKPRAYLNTSIPGFGINNYSLDHSRANTDGSLFRKIKGRMSPGELDYIHKNWDSIMNDKSTHGVAVRNAILDRMQEAGGAAELTPNDLPWTGVGNDIRHAKIAPKRKWRAGVAPVLGAYQKQYDERYAWMQKAMAKANGRKLPGEKEEATAAPAPAPAPQTPVQNPIAPQPESVSDVTTVKPTTPVGNGSVTLGGPVDLTPKTTDVGSMTFPAPTTPAAPAAAPISADAAFDQQVAKYNTQAAAAPAAPAPATPAPAPAQAAPKTPTMDDLRGISRDQMQQNRKWTAARNMNSEMDRWKTWMAMNGNRNASNADYWAWKKQQGKA